MTRRRSQTLPWALAAAGGIVQPHAAMTSGHLTWLAPVPWALALMLIVRDGHRTGRRALAASALVGLLGGLHQWGVAYYSPAVYALVCVYHASVWGLYGALAAVILRRAPALAPISAGALWAASEVLRGLGAMSYPFSFGGMLAREAPIAQLASIVGATGLSGLVWACGFAIAGLAMRAFGERRWASAWSYGPPFLLLALGGAWGAHRLARSRATPPTTRVAVLQGSVPPWMYSLASGTGPFRSVVEEHYGALFRRVLAEPRSPELVLFPETTFSSYARPSTAALRELAPFSAVRLPTETWLAVGVSFVSTDGSGSINGIAIARPDTARRPELVELVSKKQLVPFIESGHRAAQEWHLAHPGAHGVGFLICYESMYAEAARTLSANGARLLVISSDDSGLRWAPIAWTHAEQGRMRAIENGLPLVRAGQAGESYVLDAYGRQLGELSRWEVGTLSADVPLDDVATPFRRIGWRWIGPWGLVAAAPSVFTRRRKRGASDDRGE